MPQFWYTVLSKNTISSCWIEDTDELILKNFLKEIKLTYHNSLNPKELFSYGEEPGSTRPLVSDEDAATANAARSRSGGGDNLGALPKHQEINSFTLHFEFSPNNYFHDRVLTKTYYMRTLPADDERRSSRRTVLSHTKNIM